MNRLAAIGREALLLLSVMGLTIIAICGLLLMLLIILLVWIASGPRDLERSIYPSPDRLVSAVEWTEFGFPAGDTDTWVGLVGQDFTWKGANTGTFKGWLDARTVVVCGYNPPTAQVVGADGVRRTYTFLQWCSEDKPPPGVVETRAGEAEALHAKR